MRWQTITVGPDLPQFKISTDDRDFLHGNPRAFEPMNGIFGVGMMAINRHG
jgi:hypothetical protein